MSSHVKEKIKNLIKNLQRAQDDRLKVDLILINEAQDNSGRWISTADITDKEDQSNKRLQCVSGTMEEAIEAGKGIIQKYGEVDDTPVIVDDIPPGE